MQTPMAQTPKLDWSLIGLFVGEVGSVDELNVFGVEGVCGTDCKLFFFKQVIKFIIS